MMQHDAISLHFRSSTDCDDDHSLLALMLASRAVELEDLETLLFWLGCQSAAGDSENSLSAPLAHNKKIWVKQFLPGGDFVDKRHWHMTERD